jgi:16S rRNA (adenine1518-N6/adenine1519-N6)-dimethyltransferase
MAMDGQGHYKDNKVKPLKKFGQNFLTDKNIIRNILAEINPAKDDTIIEIGPGMGAITEGLYGTVQDFAVVEIDARAVDFLREKYPALKIIQNDVLKFEFSEFYSNRGHKLRIVGNIPYNITSHIILKLLENQAIISDVVLMVQKEAAERILAKQGDKDFGVLNLLLKTFTDTKICFKVPATAFYPKPRVDSVIIHLNFLEQKASIPDVQLYIAVVKAAFGNRRKILKNSLNNSIFRDLDFSVSPVNLAVRAEELQVEEFKQLTNYILTQMKG